MIIGDILKETGILFLEMAPYLMLGLFFVGLLNLFFSKDLIVRHVGKNNFSSILKAALFGVPLPLCSCGVIPTTVYLARNGASKGSVISFLISTPQTGIDSIIATYGMMGWLFGIFRPIAAFIMGIIGGAVVKLFGERITHEATQNIGNENIKNNLKNNHSERSEESNELIYNEDRFFAPLRMTKKDDYTKLGASCDIDDDCSSCSTDSKPEIIGFKSKLKKMFRYSFVEFLDDISVQFIVGVIIAGLIAYFIPETFFVDLGLNKGLPGMLIMIAIGIPMYVCATASIPIAVTLMMKGFSPGVAFVFLAVGPATNAASLTILMKVIGKKITFLYLAIISISAIIFGYILDGIFALAQIDRMNLVKHIHSHDSYLSNNIKIVIGAVFFVLLMMSLYRKYFSRKFKSKEIEMESNNSKIIKIEGMSCNHCVMNVKNAISNVQGVTSVEVSLSDNAASISGDFKLIDIEKAVEAVGYKVIKN